MSKLTLSPANRAKVLRKLPAAVAVEIAQAEQKRDRQVAQRKLEALLCQRFPDAFRVPRVPLAIGIHRQILDVAGDEIDPKELGRFMRWWCSRWDYLDAVAHGEMRVNLDGSPAGVPSEEQQRDAARGLKGPWADKFMARILARKAAHDVGAEG